jgi:hypothetical protein
MRQVCLTIRSLKRQGIVPIGLCYFCAWGPDCERVHDLFDQVIIPFEISAQNPLQKLIMTTWHERESLRKAAWFFQNCAWPSEAKLQDDVEWVAISVKNMLWRNKISDTLLGNTRR